MNTEVQKVDVLALADFDGMNMEQIRHKIVEDFGIDWTALDGADVLIAYMSVGSWGCDSSAFIVFRRDGALFEVNGSHCSCHGFAEDSYSGGDTQWQPELVESIDAVMKREDWSLAGGGYDTDSAGNAAKIRATLAHIGSDA